MPLNLGIWRIVASALVILFLSPNQRIDGAPVVPCYFIFGNSKNDNRNNNSIDTVVKANFPPFGIDYPDGPTGRFTNGKSMADLIDQGCCSIGKNHGFSTCVPHLTPCKNRDQYVFWDAYHPTEAAYQVLVKKLFGKNARSYTYPVTILQLAELRMRLPFDGSGRRLENSV
ncbi:hypothetical protein CDL15_Pgr001119 [Punica granatum]|uniref:Uncharacterized protein n=1 Tax=Punica granatum TaxID=22663 RepID=A0A218WJM0_PUNGR|nr:hypothetical protein CDL15_Pgr001119 [Punica granatum]